jgi:hypothetical protein
MLLSVRSSWCERMPDGRNLPFSARPVKPQGWLLAVFSAHQLTLHAPLVAAHPLPNLCDRLP